MEAMADVLSHEFLEGAPLLKGPLLGLAHKVVRQVEGRFHQPRGAGNPVYGQASKLGQPLAGG